MDTDNNTKRVRDIALTKVFIIGGVLLLLKQKILSLQNITDNATQIFWHFNTIPTQHIVVETQWSIFISIHPYKNYSTIHIRLEWKEKLAERMFELEKSICKSTDTRSLHILLSNMTKKVINQAFYSEIVVSNWLYSHCHDFCGAATCQLF